MHNQKNYNVYSFEPEEEKSRRMKNTIISQLTSFTYNMLSFELPVRNIKDIILDFSNYYEIDNERIDELMKNLDEYVSKNSESTDDTGNKTDN